MRILSGTKKGTLLFLIFIKKKHEFDFENVKILDRASNGKKLKLKEMLYIRKFKPSLNVQKYSQLFTFIYELYSETQNKKTIKQEIFKNTQRKNLIFRA